MGCEIFNHVMMVDGTSGLKCHECEESGDCRFSRDDKYFPKTKAYWDEEDLIEFPKEIYGLEIAEMILQQITKSRRKRH